MEELRQEILDKSNVIIDKLLSHVTFFEDSTLMKIYLQTQVIHKLFEDNTDIDINKLELFHLQFTTTLLSLLDSIKQKNDRAVKMYENEIQINNQMIEKLRNSILQEGGFDLEKQKQTINMSKSLRSLYVAFYERSDKYPFKEDISSFSINFYKDYFFESTHDILERIITYDKKNTFRNQYATIDKQLLIALGQAYFNIAFIAGVNFYPVLIELYKVQAEEEIYFLYWPAKSLFLRCDIVLFPLKKWEAEMSKQSQMIKQLIKNNQKAETNIKNTNKYISCEVLNLLEENHKTISDLDFLASLEDINIHAEILKSMLNTKML
ncbi:hypothetical protein JGH11_08340 [Dysgonomonas sp. Marseille-P4677]|uniref:hypothetical protein n=1 Tax=Dysgonomonas sp. Marseille-P4677 TaxID=2364790 RepID=UPI001912C14D|nr:hypothetical protein [Dysgonomonas sp. Marseille-P4677]MBK5720878.1 hypothetical protein [Dysgonomonas sp. Marseille-P4677]